MKQSTVSIVQVGAYVGNTPNDPLYGFICERVGRMPGSRAVLVEPVREYFEKLAENYKSIARVYLENVAIAETSGVREFYRLGVNPVDYGQPEWLSQLGSLNAERVGSLWSIDDQNVRYKDWWLQHRVIERVNCVTLSELLHKHGMSSVDFLQIDTEGYDYKILKTIDFSRLRPRFINYERELLGDSEAGCRIMLHAAGYRLEDCGSDTFCTRL